MKKSKYSRDKRSPTPKSEVISRIMSKVRCRDTTPEMLFRSVLFKNGIRGYRVNDRRFPGKPDLCFTKKKIAIFINGCFWHRCPKCKLHIPKHNREYWIDKFSKNKERDKRNLQELQLMGWKTLTFWECEIKKNLPEAISKTIKLLEQ